MREVRRFSIGNLDSEKSTYLFKKRERHFFLIRSTMIILSEDK